MDDGPGQGVLRAAILDDYGSLALESGPWERLEGRVEVDTYPDHLAGPELLERLRPYDILVLMRERTPVPRELIDRLPQLKLIVTTGRRNAAIDIQAARERGIPVCGTAIDGAPTAELTWGLILALARRIPAEDASVRSGGWQHSAGTTLTGRRLGVVGLGRQGMAVARVGLAFGMHVIAWSANLDDVRATAAGAQLVDKATLFSTADVVTIHLVLSERTRGIVGAAELAMMQSHALLINTSRGPLVDEQALIAGLKRGEIGGAGLDTYDIEPLPPEHPLRTAEHRADAAHRICFERKLPRFLPRRRRRYRGLAKRIAYAATRRRVNRAQP